MVEVEGLSRVPVMTTGQRFGKVCEKLGRDRKEVSDWSAATDSGLPGSSRYPPRPGRA